MKDLSCVISCLPCTLTTSCISSHLCETTLNYSKKTNKHRKSKWKEDAVRLEPIHTQFRLLNHSVLDSSCTLFPFLYDLFAHNKYRSALIFLCWVLRRHDSIFSPGNIYRALAVYTHTNTHTRLGTDDLMYQQVWWERSRLFFFCCHQLWLVRVKPTGGSRRHLRPLQSELAKLFSPSLVGGPEARRWWPRWFWPLAPLTVPAEAAPTQTLRFLTVLQREPNPQPSWSQAYDSERRRNISSHACQHLRLTLLFLFSSLPFSHHLGGGASTAACLLRAFSPFF